MKNKGYDVFEALEGHDIEFLQRKVTQLKQSDGEGWAIGEMVERVIKKYGKNGTIQINTNKSKEV